VEPGVIRWEGIRLSPLRSSPRPTRRRRLLPLAGLLGAVALVTTGCQSTAFTRLGMPDPITKQGKAVLTLWQGSWVAAWAVGIVVWAAIIWAVLVYRKRSDRVPHQVRYNLPIEILYTVVPFLMVGVLFYFTARDENYINKLSAHPDVVVNVTGVQWTWQFGYPQYKVPGGPGYVSETGAMWNPGAGKQNLPLLEIPVGETVRFNLVSTDVVHAFWIIPFDFKRDVIPGHPNHFEVTPTKTSVSIGRCTELCGVFHSRMLFQVKVVSQAQFRQWIASQQAQQTASGGAQ
jgi:cytochrome c oxidase subunit 2